MIAKQPAFLKRFKLLLCIVEKVRGEQQISTLTENHKKKESCYLAGKKNSIGKTTYAQVSVNEILFREGDQTLRPFSSSAGVNGRNYSLPLQCVAISS